MTVNKKVVIYTAIMGGFDGLKSPNVIMPDIEYICFTDVKGIKSDIWKIIEVENEFENPRMKARQIKLNPHLFLEDYEYSIWIDGNIIIKKDLNNLIYKMIVLNKTKIATFQHFNRDCIYAEALECVITKKDSAERIYRQVAECIDNGYPTKNGLAETNVMFRKHNELDVIQVMNDWWRCVSNNTIRDQLSFNYVLYKNNMLCEYFEGNTRILSEYFACDIHKNEKLSHILRLIFSRFKNIFK